MILVQSESTENYMKSHKIKKYFNVILNIAGHRLFSFIKMPKLLLLYSIRAQKYIANKEIN